VVRLTPCAALAIGLTLTPPPQQKNLQETTYPWLVNFQPTEKSSQGVIERAMDLDESDDAFSACPLYQVDRLGSVKRGAIGSVKKSNNKEHLGFHNNFSGVLLDIVVKNAIIPL